MKEITITLSKKDWEDIQAILGLAYLGEKESEHCKKYGKHHLTKIDRVFSLIREKLEESNSR